MGGATIEGYAVRGAVAAALALAPLAAPPVPAQQPPAATLRQLVDASQAVAAVGRDGALWPRFRPDTIPVLYVLPERGTLLVNWPAAAPPGGFAPAAGIPNAWLRPEADRGAASTSVDLGGRLAAQVVVHGGETLADLIAVTAHEAFHAFARSVREEDRRFGRGENSFLVTRYPVFDARNEGDMALEGRLLAAALRAPSDAAARAMALRFLAVRSARHRRLDAELAEFETLAELNEGLAEYVGYRASDMAAGADRTQEVADGLERLTANVTQSIRFRYYVTGPGMGYLLDRIAGAEWRARLVDDDRTLQDLLAVVVGYYEAETALRRDAAREFGGDSLAAAAGVAVDRLRGLRRAQVDSLMGGADLIVEIDAARLSRIGLCGIDPQNLLQVEPGVFLHSRWVQPCAGSAFRAEFNAPVIEDRGSLTLRAAVRDTTHPTVSAAGTPLTLVEGMNLDDVRDLVIEHPAFTVRAARADLQREGRTIRVRPYPE